MIPFTCPCGEPLTADDDHAGTTVRCPRCRAAMTVPEPGYEFDSPAPPPLATPDAEFPVRRLMEKAHAELTEDDERRTRERRLVAFTPGMVGGLAMFVACTLLAIGSLLLYNLYLAIGLLFFAVLGLVRAVLSFVGRGVD